MWERRQFSRQDAERHKHAGECFGFHGSPRKNTRDFCTFRVSRKQKTYEKIGAIRRKDSVLKFTCPSSSRPDELDLRAAGIVSSSPPSGCSNGRLHAAAAT